MSRCPIFGRLRRFYGLFCLISAGAGGWPASAQTPAEAVDVPSWKLEEPPHPLERPRLRVVTGAQAHDGVDALAGDSGTGESRVATTTLTGPGTFSFWWRCHGQEGVDRFIFDAVPLTGLDQPAAWKKVITGAAPWSRHSVVLPAGQVRMEWRLIRSGLQLPETTGGWLDEFSFVPSGTEVSIAEGVDNPTIQWRVEGEAFWGGVSEGPNGNDYGVFRPTGNINPKLYESLPPGWFSIRHSSGWLTMPPNVRYYLEESLPGGWKRTSGLLLTGGEVELAPRDVPDILVDKCLSLPDTLTVSEAVDAPQIPWTIGPSPEAWRFSPLPHESADGVDAAIPTATTTAWISGAFTGPAELRVHVRDTRSTTMNGLNVDNTLVPGWHEQRWLLHPGTTVMKWSGGAVDNVRVTPLEVVSMQEAADAPALMWNAMNDTAGAWYGVKDAAAARDGTDLLRAGVGDVPQPAVANWSGAGALQWQWRNSTQGSVDGNVLSGNPTPEWLTCYTEVPAGNHSASFTPYLFPPAFMVSEMDAFSWEAGANPWRTALDNPSGILHGGGQALWSVTTGASHTGGSALASPALKTGQTARLRIAGISGPATVKFLWKGAPDQPSRPGRAEIEGAGNTTCRLTGATDWKEETIGVASGFEWVVTPLTAEGCGAGAVLVDNVRIYPGDIYYTRPLPAAVSEALGAPGREFTLNGPDSLAATVTGAADAHDGVSALLLTGGDVQLGTTVNGPFELSFWWRGGGQLMSLFIDGAEWMEIEPPAAATLEASPWRRTVASILSSGPHTVSVRASPGSASLYVDDFMLTAPGVPGTFSAAVGNPPLEWSIPDVGAGHAVPDPATPRGTSVGARLGASASTSNDSGTFRCRVAGPALVRGWWRHNIAEGGFSIAFPGTSARREWEPFRYFVPWTEPVWITFYRGSITGAPPEAVWLDSLTVEPWRAETIGETLSSPELSWNATPANEWGTQQYERRVRLNGTPGIPGPELTVPLTGPGFFITAYSAGFDFELDGEARTSFWVPLAGGEHTARWRLNPGATPGTAYIDGPARFIPFSGATVAAALDLEESPGLTLVSAPAGTTGIVDPHVPLDGRDCAVSPPLHALSSPADVKFSATGPGKMRFHIRAMNNCYMKVLVDEVEAVPEAQLEAWTRVEVPVPGGAHEIVIRTRNPQSPDIYDSYVLLDRVKWYADLPGVPAAGEALDDPGRVWRERAAQPFAVSASLPEAPAPFGGTMARSGLLYPGDYTWLETEVQGPGTVSLTALTRSAIVTSANRPAEAVWGTTRIRLERLGLSQFPDLDIRFRIPDSGPQTLRILFSNPLTERDAMWAVMDRFQFSPDAAGPGLGEASGAPSLTWSADPADWHGIDAGVHGKMLTTGNATPPGPRVLRLTVPGNGTLSWRWKTDNASMWIVDASGTILRGYSPFMGNLVTPWESVTLSCLPQQRELEFRTDLQFADAMAQIADVVWTPAPVVSLAEAAYAPDAVWTMSRPNAWIGRPGGEVISGALNHGEAVWLETVVTPPAYVRFEWQAYTDPGDVLTFSVNGTQVASVSGGWGSPPPFTQPWAKHIGGTAPQTLRWTYTKNDSFSAGYDTAILRGLTITRQSPNALAQAVNAFGIQLISGSEGPPGSQNTPPFLPLRTPSALSGGLCAGYFSADYNASAWLEGTVTGPGMLSFACSDSFSLLVDGQTQTNGADFDVSGEAHWYRAWRRFTDNGTHTVRIRCNSPSQGTILVDDVRFDPLQTLSALNAPGLTLSTGSPPWFSFGTVARGCAAAPWQSTGTSFLEATVTGPSLLFFAATGSGMLLLDGTFAAGIGTSIIDHLSGRPPWRYGCFVPPGVHTVRWTCKDDQRLWLTDLALRPLPNPSLPSLLNAPDLWMLSPAPDSYFAANDVTIAPGDPCLEWRADTIPFQVMLPGPGRLEGQWSGPFSGTASNVHLSLGLGSLVVMCPSPGSWAVATSPENSRPGLMTVANSAGTPGQQWSHRLVLVDQIRYVPVQTVTPAEALDCDALTVTGLNGWRMTPDQVLSSDSEDLAVAIATPTSVPGPLTATVQGPVTLTFWWRVESGTPLTLSVDGVAFNRSPSSVGERMRLELGAGPHTLAWSLPPFTSGMAMLDAFTSTPGVTLLNYVSPHIPALFSLDGTLTVETSGGSTGLMWKQYIMPEILLPGPGVTEAPDGLRTLHAHSGLKRMDFTAAPRTPPFLTSWPVWRLTSVPLADALDTALPVTTSGGWTGSAAGGSDFAWIHFSGGDDPQWIETTVRGPGWLTWNEAITVSGITLFPPDVTVNGAPAPPPGQGAGVVRLNEAMDYTVRWTAELPGGEAVFALDHLTWAPDTPENHPAAWLASFGLTGAEAALTADPDKDGKNNLLEFALGGDPVRADSSAGITPLVVADGGVKFPGIAFNGRNLSRLLYRLEYETSSEGAFPAWFPEQVYSSPPLEGNGPVFARRIVSGTPLPADRKPVLLRLSVQWMP